MADTKKKIKFNPTREKIFEIIFEADTPAGKRFDIFLIIAIITSVLVVMLESVNGINERFGQLFRILEWAFTIFFTAEYILRLLVVHRPIKYATSFFGIVDLLAIIPSYLSFFVIGSHSLLVIRALRLLRVFRIFKLWSFMSEGRIIVKALQASQRKISVFLMFILLMVIIFGSVMYLIEGRIENSGFDSIPRSIYWAIVTLTTVGYGDISPVTPIGQFIAAIVMMLGYAVIAVPTGIVSAEFVSGDGSDDGNGKKKGKITHTNTQVCQHCSTEGHNDDAIYCYHCGEELHPNNPES